MMNQEYKEKWVAALRSGDYKQGRGRLQNEDGFCCLGVLCDVAAKEEPLTYKWEKHGGNNPIMLTPTGSYGITEIPKHLSHELGLVNSGGNAITDPTVDYITKDGILRNTYLSALNDEYRLSFNELADLIEAQL